MATGNLLPVTISEPQEQRDTHFNGGAKVRVLSLGLAPANPWGGCSLYRTAASVSVVLLPH